MASIRRLATLIVALTCSAWAQPGKAAEQPSLSAVADLRYGVALYNYYQNQNLEALSELMVAQKRGGIQGHGDNPEIMEGGFHLAYGMERKASDIFTRLLDANRPERTRNAAWFYLAQMRYLRNDWASAASALEKISADPDPDLAQDILALRFNLALRNNDFAAARKTLRDRTLRDSAWLPYMHYNLGAAHSRAGEYAQSIPLFEQLRRMEQRTPEYLALYDKAMTAAGYSYLLDQQYEQAIEQFTQVRLDSPLSNRALLGYGWAAVELGDYAQALSPWQVLAARSLVDESTQEALVAVPYAYEKMGYQAQALEQFRAAEASYRAEIASLDQVIGNMQGYAIREALNIDRSTDINWLDHAKEDQLSPQLTYLVTLFSQEAFLGLVQELRDLLAIQNNFRDWQKKLQFYLAMLDEREANRAQDLDHLAQQQLAEKVATLEAKRNQYAAEVAQLEQGDEFLRLLDPEDSAKLERLQRAQKNVEVLQRANGVPGLQVIPAEELAELAETLRKQRGFMIWRSSEMYAERLWRVRKALDDVDQQLAQMGQVQSNVSAIVQQGFDLDPYRESIQTASEELVMQSVDVDRAIELSQDALRRKVLAVLDQQRVRLQHYLAQSRVSIARLLDAAAVRDTDSPASPESSPTSSEIPPGEVSP